jgi:predicted phage-related endonuclease
MKIYDFEQGSEEWLKVRLGKITASDFHILMGNSQTKDTLLYKKAAERITGVASDGDKFASVHTERGKELESEARQAYELETGNIVEQVGFIELDEFVGCSPDGLIQGGGVEIKCKDNHGHLKAVTKKWIDPEHRTQLQFNMYVKDAGFWDYCLYNPNFSNSLYIERVARDEEYIKKIQETIIDCNSTIQKIIKQFWEV